MDYLRKFLPTFLFLFTIVNLTSCSTEADSGAPQIAQVELSRDPIVLLGTPPDEVYYGDTFDYPFTVSGGTGNYTVTYEPNPEIEATTFYTENEVDLKINASDDTFENTFRLQGLVQPPLGGDTFDESSSRFTVKYAIVVSDGENTETFEFDLTVEKTKIVFSEISAQTEGAENISQWERAKNQKLNGADYICDSILDLNPVPKVIDGVYAYPIAVRVRRDALLQEDVSYHYYIESEYKHANPERSNTNLSYARPNVDYLQPEDNEIRFKSGQGVCVIIIYVTDDQIVEEDELFRLEFRDIDDEAAKNRIVDISHTLSIEIRDNEPKFKYEPKVEVLNEGDSSVFTLTPRSVHTNEINLNVYVDSSETTAQLDDYSISPSTGVLTVDAGSLFTNFVVEAEENDDISSEETRSELDDVVVIKTDIDLLEHISDPSKIEINEWPLDNDLSREIVGLSVDNETVIDFSVDGGYINVLADVEENGKRIARLKTYFRDATEVKNAEGDYQEISHSTLDVIPTGIASLTKDTLSYLIVTFAINGQYANTHRGKTDFGVAIYTRENGSSNYTLDSVKQYGTEEDDHVSGIKAYDDAVYVYGSTTGKFLEGSGSVNASQGANEGFIYKIDLTENSAVWSTFVGTEANDDIVSLDVSGLEVISLLSTEGVTKKGEIKTVSSATGNPKSTNDFIINSELDDYMVDITYDGQKSGFRALYHSKGDLSTDSGRTPSLSQDAFIGGFESDSTAPRAVGLATSSDDFAASIHTLTDNENFVVGGYTKGTFQQNIKIGEQTEDAFISIYEGDVASKLRLSHTIQFGSEHDDRVMSIESFSDNKFMVLWKSTNTVSGDVSYRVSAFSKNGIKLSANP